MAEGLKHLEQINAQDNLKRVEVNEFIGKQVLNIEERIQSSDKNITGKVQEIEEEERNT